MKPIKVKDVRFSHQEQRDRPGIRPSLYAQLSAPLPPEALTPIPGTDRTAINDAYVKERLNQVLGPDGWVVSEPKIIALGIQTDSEQHPMVGLSGKPLWNATVSVNVTIKTLEKKYHGFGGCNSEDKGDALKGAATDAFGKAISDLIGIEVYKGLVDSQNLPQTAQYSEPDSVGTSTSRNNKYLWHTGILTDRAGEVDDPRCWFLANGVLCYAERTQEEMKSGLAYESNAGKIARAPLGSKITFHAIREYTKRGSVLKVVSVLEVRQFDKIVIPEMK